MHSEKALIIYLIIIIIIIIFELYEQLLPTRVYASQKTHTGPEGKAMCRLRGKALESVAHILSGCSALAQIKYLS